MTLHEEFERLSRARDEKQQAYQSSQAKLESAKERLVELEAEAKKYGVENLSNLDQVIQDEEAAIAKELQELAKVLETDQPITKALTTAQSNLPSHNLDDLLEIGTSR